MGENHTATEVGSDGNQNEFDYAPASTRLIANIIDNFVILLSFGVVLSTGVVDFWLYFPLLIAWIAFAVFYLLILEGVRTNQTLGKFLLNIRVLSEDGSEPTKTQAASRNVIGLMGQLFGAIGLLVGGWLIYSSERNQRFGDRSARTIVVITYN